MLELPVESAVRAGVEHVVKVTSSLSGFAHSPAARPDRNRERADRLRARLHAAEKQRLHAEFPNAGPRDRQDGQLRLLSGRRRIGLFNARDDAAVAAEMLFHPPHTREGTYLPTGPERLSYSDAAAVLAKVLGLPITFHPLTFEEERQAMINARVPESVAEMNARAVFLFAQGDSDWITDDVASLLGWPARTFEQFATDTAAAFL